MCWILVLFLWLILWFCIIEECKYKLWGIIVVLIIFNVFVNGVCLFIVCDVEKVFVLGISFLIIFFYIGFDNVIW